MSCGGWGSGQTIGGGMVKVAIRPLVEGLASCDHARATQTARYWVGVISQAVRSRGVAEGTWIVTRQHVMVGWVSSHNCLRQSKCRGYPYAKGFSTKVYIEVS